MKNKQTCNLDQWKGKKVVTFFSSLNQWNERCKYSLGEINFSFKLQLKTCQALENRFLPKKAGRLYIYDSK